MYKRHAFLTLLVLWFLTCNAQLSVSVREPPVGIVQKSQLWNLALIYSGANSITITIGLTVVDLRDNQPVLTGFSRPVMLSKGVRQIKAQDVSPVDYRYVSPAFSRLTDAFLPVGTYRACYSVFTIENETETILWEDCIHLEVQPLSPPQLAIPADSARLQNLYPQFSWLPPAPIALFNDLNYDLVITEVRVDQSPEAAIQENLPVYNVSRLTAMVNNYPSSAKSLDTGKVYAWRVIAKNGETFAAQSEVWTFRIQQEDPETPTPTATVYMELKRSNTPIGTGVITSNILGIRYYSYDKSHEASVKFLNEKGEVIKEIRQTIDYGNNFMVFKLDRSFSKGTTYFIEITDLQMSRYSASFRMSN